MSRFTDTMHRNAATVSTGMVTGEPHAPVRHTWSEVHDRARRIAGGLAAAGVVRRCFGAIIGNAVGASISSDVVTP